ASTRPALTGDLTPAVGHPSPTAEGLRPPAYRITFPLSWRERGPGGEVPHEGFWSRLAAFVLRHPWRVLVPVLVLLVVLGAPFTQARLSTPDARILPPDTPSRRAADLLSREF